MKPKDLKSPFTFEERRPLIEEGIFYVPTYYANYAAFSLPCWKEIFANAHPVQIEYCSGNGEWIIERAKQHPQINWVAVEKKFERVRKIHSKRMNQKIVNLFIVCGDALLFAREYLPKNSVSAAFVNFPDPWPKVRHAKHRLIQAPFVREVFKSLQNEGKFTLVSDAKAYIEEMCEAIGQEGSWKSHKTTFPASYGSSYFKRLWQAKGRKIYCLKYECIKP